MLNVLNVERYLSQGKKLLNAKRVWLLCGTPVWSVWRLRAASATWIAFRCNFAYAAYANTRTSFHLCAGATRVNTHTQDSQANIFCQVLQVSQERSLLEAVCWVCICITLYHLIVVFVVFQGLTIGCCKGCFTGCVVRAGLHSSSNSKQTNKTNTPDRQYLTLDNKQLATNNKHKTPENEQPREQTSKRGNQQKNQLISQTKKQWDKETNNQRSNKETRQGKARLDKQARTTTRNKKTTND